MSYVSRPPFFRKYGQFRTETVDYHVCLTLYQFTCEHVYYETYIRFFYVKLMTLATIELALLGA